MCKTCGRILNDTTKPYPKNSKTILYDQVIGL